MNVSSRTPEGVPSRCPLCDAAVSIEYSSATGDSTCPNCGCLIWRANEILEWLQRTAGNNLGMPPEQISAGTEIIAGLKADSLDVVELVMEIEEAYDLTIPDDDYQQFQTVADVIRYILRRRQGPR